MSSTKVENFELVGDVEHLTCFIGGMVGMAAKIFGLEDDLEIAKRLADGCVWAYGITPSGIMPESATVLPCKNAERCTWNETIYHRYLDPGWKTRDESLRVYLENKKKFDTETGLSGPEVVRGDRRMVKRETSAPTSSYDERAGSIEAEFENGPVGRQSEVVLGDTPEHSTESIDNLPPDPDRPSSHKEYIENFLNNTRIPIGMTSMRGEAYHLR